MYFFYPNYHPWTIRCLILLSQYSAQDFFWSHNSLNSKWSAAVGPHSRNSSVLPPSSFRNSWLDGTVESLSKTQLQSAQWPPCKPGIMSSKSLYMSKSVHPILTPSDPPKEKLCFPSSWPYDFLVSRSLFQMEECFHRIQQWFHWLECKTATWPLWTCPVFGLTGKGGTYCTALGDWSWFVKGN